MIKPMETAFQREFHRKLTIAFACLGVKQDTSVRA
jgi:hypothetical protein